jgi:hypothetical protein
MTILAIANIQLDAGVEFKMRIAGVQNPRYQILDAKSDKNQAWKLETFDTDLDPVTLENSHTQHLIDEGVGGYFNIDELSEIQTFGADA